MKPNSILDQIRANVAASETAVTVTIYQPDGEPYEAPESTKEDPVPATIDVLGSESKAYEREEKAIQRRNIRSKKPVLDAADLHRNRLDQAAACITAWHGWTNAGAALECDAENKRVLLSHKHILQQVEAGIHGHADFSRSSSET